VMMLQGDNVTQRMSLNEVNSANERALASYNASKPKRKRKSSGRKKNTTTVEVSVVIPYRKSRRLANKETENKE